jgi:hypothetical protein
MAENPHRGKFKLGGNAWEGSAETVMAEALRDKQTEEEKAAAVEAVVGEEDQYEDDS